MRWRTDAVGIAPLSCFTPGWQQPGSLVPHPLGLPLCIQDQQNMKGDKKDVAADKEKLKADQKK